MARPEAPSERRSLLVRNAPAARLALAVAVAVAGVGLVTLLALADSVSEVIPALLYVVVIAAAAALGGLWPGLFASVLAYVPFNYFFTEPKHDLALANGEDAFTAVAFVVAAVVVSLLFEQQRRAVEAEHEARAEAEAAADTAGRLQRVAAALAGAVTPQDVLGAVVTHGVRAAEARSGVIALLDEDGFLEVVAHRGYRDDLIERFRRFPTDADLPFAEVVRTGRPLFFSSRAERDAAFPGLTSVGDESHAFAALPLVVEDQAIGALGLSFDADREFHEARRELKLTLARQAAQAIERARLYEAQRKLERRLSFLSEASALLASSLDYERTLARLAELAVPRLADWCAIDMVGEDGTIERLAVAHEDPEKLAWARELQERYPPDPDAPYGVPNVLRTGEPELFAEIPDELLVAATEGDEELLRILRELGLSSSICVPLVARGRALGALTLIASESGRHYDERDLDLARELARRAAVAVDNALLYREAEKRGDAARALEYVGDGVVLLDRAGVVRFWNPGAERIFRIDEREALGRPVLEAAPAWATIDEHVAPAGAGGVPRPVTVPAAVGGAERWVSASAVAFADGTVYALRDTTAEHELERTRSDFVATASHELRTPLAAVYGAARTLRRHDSLGEEERAMFLEIMETESERLAQIVNQMLLAGQLGAGDVQVVAEACDAGEVVRGVVESATLRAPKTIALRVTGEDGLPPLTCDANKLRQVLVNLVDNAVKYSPQGGEVEVALASRDGRGRIEVRDRGLGVPGAERERIFEKFYRLDPALTKGVGGTGLGLYISRELVQRMGGRLWVESRLGPGSSFVLELPLAR